MRIQRRVLGVDYGKARVGVAVSDELRLLAHPLETLSTPHALRRIGEIAREKNVERIVVGLPRHMSGDSGTAAAEVLQFVAALRTSSGCEVITQDERLTTVAAQRALQQSGRNSRNSRSVIDQVAAQMILQTHLDSCQRDDPEDGC